MMNGEGLSALSSCVFEVSISRLLFLITIYSHLCLGTKLRAALWTQRFVSVGGSGGITSHNNSLEHGSLSQARLTHFL